jgi:hypothetical protein
VVGFDGSDGLDGLEQLLRLQRRVLNTHTEPPHHQPNLLHTAKI